MQVAVLLDDHRQADIKTCNTEEPQQKYKMEEGFVAVSFVLCSVLFYS